VKTSFSSRGWTDYLALLEDDVKTLRRLNRLIEECKRDPFRGTGKPEPLKDNLKGWWSRRVTEEHRLIYRVTGRGDDQLLEIAQCRFHY
jgi:toxin YoeB